MKFVFNIEPADRSVGIMSESFAGWMEDAPHYGYWCELVEYTAKFDTAKFQWYDSESNVLSKEKYIPYKNMVERMLFSCIQEYYRGDDEDEDEDEDEDDE